MEINIRTRFENLLKWLIPFFILSVLVNFLSTELLKHSADAIFASKGNIPEKINYILLGLQGIKFLFNIAVAIWLFFQAKDLKFNKLLWPLFGLAKPSGAIVIFMLILVYECRKTQSENLETQA